MVERISLDLARLRETGTDLGRIAREFTDADANAKDLAAAVGHDRLADAVTDFATRWNDTRADMTEDIDILAKSATGISDAFTQLDTEYARALGGSQ